MLANHVWLIIAEQFGTLEALRRGVRRIAKAAETNADAELLRGPLEAGWRRGNWSNPELTGLP